MIPVFIDIVSVVTIRCKNTKGFDTETKSLKFSRAPMFSRTPIIKKKSQSISGCGIIWVPVFKLFLYAPTKAIQVTLVAIKLAFFYF